MWLCVLFPLQSKFMYTSSSTSFGSYVSDKNTGYHFHILAQPHPCRIHAWQYLFPTWKFGFVQKNSHFGLAPDKKHSLILMITNIYLFLQAWAAHYNKLDHTSMVFNWGYHQMMHHNNCPQQTQLCDLIICYCVNFHPNPYYNWLN